MGVCMALAVPMIGYLTLGWLIIYVCYPTEIDHHAYLQMICLGAVMLVVSALLIWPSVKVCKKGIAESRRLPYVPPLNPDTLPAEEVLVRGAEEPPIVPSEVLLRATNERETPKEELLRAVRQD